MSPSCAKIRFGVWGLSAGRHRHSGSSREGVLQQGSAGAGSEIGGSGLSLLSQVPALRICQMPGWQAAGRAARKLYRRLAFPLQKSGMGHL